MPEFKAIIVEKNGDSYSVSQRSVDDGILMDGDVLVRVSHTTINYKDGLAITGSAPVVRRFPMIPGIDFAGVVEDSSSPRFAVGDKVLLNGWGVGEAHLGGFAELARVKAEWLQHLPAAFSPEQAMAIGTAGYTAALSVLAIEDHGLDPNNGPAVVTGAAGGVGSVAVALLAAAGWQVVASTGRAEEAEYLKRLGAVEIIDRAELAAPSRPLAKERWAAGIDVVGSTTLASVLAATRYGGAIAACGLAGGMDLPTSVAPFILRGVALLGVDSVMAPMDRRDRAWSLLADRLDLAKLEALTTVIAFDEIVPTAHKIIEGKIRGRVVARI